MKNIIFMLVFVIVAMAANAQKGVTKTMTAVVLNGAVTAYSAVVPATGTYETLSFAVKCTQLGGTSDGYFSVLASNDGTNYFNLNAANGYPIWGSPNARVNDSIPMAMTIYPAATLNIVLKPAHRFYKLSCTGTSGDTTSLGITYIFK